MFAAMAANMMGKGAGMMPGAYEAGKWPPMMAPGFYPGLWPMAGGMPWGPSALTDGARGMSMGLGSSCGSGLGLAAPPSALAETLEEGEIMASLAFPKQVMGRVIGKGGLVIKQIREETGARIDANDREDDQCEFRVAGTPEAVEKAKALIKEKAGRRLSPSGREDRQGEIEGPYIVIDFPSQCMGGIIGSRGANIAEVRSSSGAKVNVDRVNGRCQVKVGGSDEQIAAAKRMIERLAAEEAGAAEPAERFPERAGSAERAGSDQVVATESDSITEVMEFPLFVAGKLIGTRGSTIHDVRHRSGARVNVEKKETRCRVVMNGSFDEVERARVLVRALGEEGLVEEQFRGAELRMEVPQAVVGRVIGKGGETIQRLNRESGAFIEVDAKSRRDPCPMRINGTPQAIAKARLMVEEIIGRFSGTSPPAEAPTMWPLNMMQYGAPPWSAFGAWGNLPPAGDGTPSSWANAGWFPGAGGVPRQVGSSPGRGTQRRTRSSSIDVDEL